MSELVLLGISGSLRQAATNRKLIREAGRLFGPSVYVEADLNLPLYDGDEEARHGLPAGVTALATDIARADAVVISTPEYNKGPSGVLKNALDWVSRTDGSPFLNKPVAVMSAAAGRAGGERAQSILRACLVSFRPLILQGPEMHLSNSGQEFGEDGRLLSDRYTATLQELMSDLRALAEAR